MFAGRPVEPFGLVYKKTDSMLRGNVGSELEALLELTGCDAAVLAPSLPENGRRVKDGMLYADFADGTQLVFPAADRVRETTSLLTSLADFEIPCRNSKCSLKEVAGLQTSS